MRTGQDSYRISREGMFREEFPSKSRTRARRPTQHSHQHRRRAKSICRSSLANTSSTSRPRNDRLRSNGQRRQETRKKRRNGSARRSTCPRRNLGPSRRRGRSQRQRTSRRCSRLCGEKLASRTMHGVIQRVAGLVQALLYPSIHDVSPSRCSFYFATDKHQIYVTG